MFISENIVFMELHKTGCTHIRNLLNQLLDGRFVGKHNQATPDLFNKNNRTFLGSIRDPWEWYISLWAYGCDKRGAIYGQVTMPPKLELRRLGWKITPYITLTQALLSVYRWRNTYKNVDNASAFREWLYMMHDKKYQRDFFEGFSTSLLSEFSGLLTYRYIKLFCCEKGDLAGMNSLSTFDELKAYENANCFIDHFILNERLTEDLLKALKLSGVSISDKQKSNITTSPKTNMSSRKNGASYYYDSDTENLVYERERLIVEKFGYTRPSTRS